MPENKSSLRLAAGILLLISCLLNIGSLLTTLISPAVRYSLGQFFALYWQSLLSFLLVLLVGVFVLARQFTGAGIAECGLALLWLLNLIGRIRNFHNFPGYYPTAYIIMLLLAAFLSLAVGAAAALGFFLKGKRSKPLFFCAAGVGFLNSVLGYVRDYVVLQNALNAFYQGGGTPVWSRLLVLLFTLFGAAFPFLAWLFLGIYFGDQGERTFQPGYPPVPPRYSPQGGYPSYQNQGYPPQQGGYPNYQNQGYPPQQGGYPNYQNQAYAPPQNYAPQPQDPPAGDASSQN